jgi:hypothetical protein
MMNDDRRFTMFTGGIPPVKMVHCGWVVHHKSSSRGFESPGTSAIAQVGPQIGCCENPQVCAQGGTWCRLKVDASAQGAWSSLADNLQGSEQRWDDYWGGHTPVPG